MINSIVFGSSRGIGLAIVKQLLKENHKVLGISRGTPSIKNSNYKHINMDISLTEIFENYLKNLNFNSFDNYIICAGTNDIANLKNLSIESESVNRRIESEDCLSHHKCIYKYSFLQKKLCQ